MDQRELGLWDQDGVLVVPGVLSPPELARARRLLERCASAIRRLGLLSLEKPDCEPFREMLVHPAVVQRLNILCGEGFRLDEEPVRLDQLPGAEAPELSESTEPHALELGYQHPNAAMHCGGVAVAWQLGDVDEPEAGSALFYKDGASSPHHAVLTRDRPGPWLLYRYTPRNSARAGPAAAQARPERWWGRELVEDRSDVERAVMYGPYANEDGSVPYLEVGDDGGVRTESCAVGRTSPWMSEQEKAVFARTGFLVMRGLLSAEAVAECNRAIDHFAGSMVTRPRERSLARGSQRLRGEFGRSELRGMLAWPAPFREPFWRLLVHAAVVSALNELCGKGFRLDQDPLLLEARRGSEGHALHRQAEPFDPASAHGAREAVLPCSAITVSWQLGDTEPEDGGFVVLPGSHVGREPTPRGFDELQAEPGGVFHPEMKAGDALFFAEAVSHGVLPWTASRPRRAVLYKYASRSACRGPGRFFTPEQRWGAWTRELTTKQRALLHGPGRGRAASELYLESDGLQTRARREPGTP